MPRAGLWVGKAGAKTGPNPVIGLGFLIVGACQAPQCCISGIFRLRLCQILFVTWAARVIKDLLGLCGLVSEREDNLVVRFGKIKIILFLFPENQDNLVFVVPPRGQGILRGFCSATRTRLAAQRLKAPGFLLGGPRMAWLRRRLFVKPHTAKAGSCSLIAAKFQSNPLRFKPEQGKRLDRSLELGGQRSQHAGLFPILALARAFPSRVERRPF